MSRKRLALVSEGDTDKIVIEAALNALLREPFVLISLQPEPTLPKLGQGWGGVLKWCDQYSDGRVQQLSDHPFLSGYDGIILHIDADVTNFRYEDYEKLSRKTHWLPLPCKQVCPPPEASVGAIQAVVLSWLRMGGIGPRGLFCIPSKSTEAWVAVALFPQDPRTAGIECKKNPTAILTARPKGEKVPKTKGAYSAKATAITDAW